MTRSDSFVHPAGRVVLTDVNKIRLREMMEVGPRGHLSVMLSKIETTNKIRPFLIQTRDV